MNAPRVTVLIVTRARPKMLAEVFASLAASTTRKDCTNIWLYVDEDDTVTRSAIAANEFPDPERVEYSTPSGSEEFFHGLPDP